MVIKNVSSRTLVLRDVGGTEYRISAYGDLTINSSLWTDNTFRTWVRQRGRDLVMVEDTPQLAYAEVTTNTNATSTTTGSAAATCSAITLDGTTKIEVVVFSPTVTKGTTWTRLGYADGSGTNMVGLCHQPASTAAPCFGSRIYTPSAGTYTYSLRGTVDAGTGVIGAGDGTAGNLVPAYIRVRRVP